MTSQLLRVIFFLTLSQALCQYITDGPCPTNRPVVQNFDLKKYTGVWNELARYEVFYEVGCDCVFANYTLYEDGSVKVENNCKKLPNTDLTTGGGRGVISFPNASPVEGKLNITIGSAPNTFPNYLILDTDYNHYAIVYNCVQLGDKSVEVAWVFSKGLTLVDSVKQKVNDYIDTYFERSQFRWTQLDPKICYPEAN